MYRLHWGHQTVGAQPESVSRSGPKKKKLDQTRRIVAVILCCTMVVLPATRIAAARTIYVDACASGGGVYNTLINAVTAASPGDTIVLNSGVYRETPRIDKALTLTAAGADVLVGKVRDFDVGTLEVCVPLQVVAGAVCCHCVTPDLCTIAQLPLLCPSALGGCASDGSEHINAKVYYPSYGGRAVCGSPVVVYAHGFRSEGWPLCNSGNDWDNPGPVYEDYRQAEGILRQLAASGILVISFDASCGVHDVGRGAFALNALAYLRSEFEGVVDLSRVGFAGHSLGGGGAVYAAMHVSDPAFSALNLNDVEVRAVALIAPGFVDTLPYLGELDAPSLTIYGTADRTLIDPVYNMVGAPKHLVVITGANHFGYTDDICIARGDGFDLPSTVGGVTGPEAHARQQQTARNYIHAFFSRYLLGDSSAMDYLVQQAEERCDAGDPPNCGEPRRFFDDLEALNVEVSVCSCQQ